MDKVCLSPARLCGTLTVPPSKSMAHRLLLCAALAPGVSRIRNIDWSEDIRATLDAVRALGATAQVEGRQATIDGSGTFSVSQTVIDCGESGSTLRFLLPIAAAGGVCAAFHGRGRLPSRPLGELTRLLRAHGVACEAEEDRLPVRLSGRLQSGCYELPGNVSSQYITGLLFALPLCHGDSELRLTTPLESAGYVDLTCAPLQQFGITVTPTETGWRIPGGQTYRPCDTAVEGDWSQAAFFLAAGALGGTLRLRGLDPASRQGDRACLTLFRQFGASVVWDGNDLICKADHLAPLEIDAAQIPDLVPILAATAAFCPGETRIVHAARLRSKESDRLAAMADGLRRLGCPAKETPDGLRIPGGHPLQGGAVHGYHDHRVVMAFAIAALRAGGGVTIDDAQSIRKSYPQFFEDYRRLGGKADVVHLG